MNAVVVTESRAALAPLVDALRAQADEDAERALAAAAATAAALLAQAHAEADAILARARQLGTAEGASAAVAARTRGLRAARTAELAAQDDVYRELGRRVTERVAAWCARPDTRALLLARTHEVLGEHAVVADAPGGGLLASTAGHRLDLDAATLAARAVDALGAEIAGLWAP